MRNYNFDGSITVEVLNNYLDRALTHMMFATKDDIFCKERLTSGIRAIKNTGAKYIQRAIAQWAPTIEQEIAYKEEFKKGIEAVHAFDPQVIFEGCIFENVTEKLNNIPIPAHVFEDFGLPVEERNFNLDKMLFNYDLYRNQWGQGCHVPDITKQETRLFFYHRACRMIDIGVEALHLGQTGLIGKFDTANRWWSETINRIRAYALKNARRHYVIINSHWSKHNFVGDHGRMLQDFNAYPCRIRAIAGQEDHAPTEENPQYCDLPIGYQCSTYKADKMGITPSGEFTEHYPYLVEFDNWGVKKHILNKCIDQWGYDEISWYMNQPKWYRHQFYKDSVELIDSYHENGHFAAAGSRCGYSLELDKTTYYFIDMKKDNEYGYDDEDFIRDFWASRE